ncbi:histone family protein [Nanoarchaeota archaeon]
MPKRSTIIPQAPIGRILVNSGAKRVSAEAIEAFVDVLEDIATDISKQALQAAKHAGRKTIHDSDIKIASKG